MEWSILWVDTQTCTICLHESPQYILCRFVDVRTTSVLREVPLQRDLWNSINSYLRKRKRESTFGSFLRNTSILFMNKIIEVRRNHLELIIESNNSSDSAMRFYSGLD